MRIKISSPPTLYDNERLNAWLCELALAVNMGFANISYDNLSNELKNEVERVINNSQTHD